MKTKPNQPTQRFCPSCGRQMHPDNAMNARSRFASAYICNKCGVWEATQGFFWRSKAEQQAIEIREGGLR